MSKPEFGGVSLTEFADPIRWALDSFIETSEGMVTFDNPTGAAQLEVTPDKPNYARSVTTFKHLGETIGNLYVIAFLPGDGSGDESTFRLEDVNTWDYPGVTQVIPRSKAGLHSEVHLGLAARAIDAPNADVRPHVNHLDLIGVKKRGLVPNQLERIGTLGNRRDYFDRALRGEADPGYGVATSTLWSKEQRRDGFKRFGDPHAVYNAHPEAIQVCGFVAVDKAADPKHHSLAQDLFAYPATQR